VAITHLGASVQGAIDVAGTRHTANAQTVDAQRGNMGAADANVAANFGTSMLRHACARGVASSDKDARLFPSPDSNASAEFRPEQVPKGRLT
jgi:hypothetical protein